MGVSVRQLVGALVLDFWESDLRFRTDSNKLNASTHRKLLDLGAYAWVYQDRSSVEGRSCNSCQSLTCAASHCTCQDDYRSRLNEFQSIGDLSDSEIWVGRVINPNELSKLAHWNLHVGKTPCFVIISHFRFLGDECLTEDFRELCLIVEFLSFDEFLLSICVLMHYHFFCSAALGVDRRLLSLLTHISNSFINHFCEEVTIFLLGHFAVTIGVVLRKEIVYKISVETTCLTHV